MRRLNTEEESVLIVDERVGDQFTAQGNDIEWMMYGWSILRCLPVGMTNGSNHETGTVMRTDTLRKYADEAGFYRDWEFSNYLEWMGMRNEKLVNREFIMEISGHRRSTRNWRWNISGRVTCPMIFGII